MAHSQNAAGCVHYLDDHLTGTADLAGAFATPFRCDTYARTAGLWHDLGKNALAFQRRLTDSADAHTEDGAPGRVDHSSAGALHALRTFGNGVGLPLAFAIAGHHGGLADLPDLHARLLDKADRLDAAVTAAGAVIPACGRPTPPPFLAGLNETPAGKRRYEFWVRMLFSCLVDADFLDTEAHFDAGRAAGRGGYPTPGELLATFNAFMAARGGAGGPVNAVRRRILEDCRRRGRESGPGVFTLTAPTGAGKTLAGMGFALEHAVAHARRRVIVVIPYTSIIDQNARVYRDVFGAADVIDHHASLDPKKETHRNRVACENWDAPVVVTTSVQFLESLFANRPSRCRKLHNVVNSVVLFDEVQTLPIPFLLPIVDALKELVADYGVTLVLSTATQPALGVRPAGPGRTFPGFEAATEIVSDVPRAFAELRRVAVHFPPDRKAPVTWPDLARELADRPQVLAVVHRRDDARDLVRELDAVAPGSIHLSALMCPAHRLAVIDEVRSLLADNRVRRERREAVVPVRLVSTQLIEAGVDLDFPVVYRAMAGFDSIAQAAGRCNREGLLDGPGEVRVFVAPTPPPPGTLRAALGVAASMLDLDPELDPLDPAVFGPYFRQLYTLESNDREGVQALRQEWKFKSVAETFRVIEDDDSEAVVVPYGDAEARLADVRRFGPSRERLRALQPFVVTLYGRQLETLRAAGALETVADTVTALSAATHRHLYDPRFGLLADGPLAADPSSLTG